MRDRDRGISYLVELPPTLDSPERGKPLFSAAVLLHGRALSAAVIDEFGSGSFSVGLPLDVLGPHGRLVTVSRSALSRTVSGAEAMICAFAHPTPARNERSTPPGAVCGASCRSGLIVASSRNEQCKAAQRACCLARL